MYIPANPPASGPPGPLTTGYRSTARPLTESFPRAGSLGAADLGSLIKQPLFLGAMALAAFVLWQSGKKPKRKNPTWRRRRRVTPGRARASRQVLLSSPAFRRRREYVVSWPEGGRTRRRTFHRSSLADSWAARRKGSKLFARSGRGKWKRIRKMQ